MKIDDVVKHLLPPTQADPTLLANYVIALLKNNKPKNELQKLCIEQLYDFIGEGTKAFVVKLFHALEGDLIQLSQAEKESNMLSQTALVPAVDHVREFQSSLHRLEKASSLNAQAGSDNEDVTDEEDDDRNHKHRRRATRSHSFDRDQDNDEEEGDARDADGYGRGHCKSGLSQEQLQANVGHSVTVEAFIKSERLIARGQGCSSTAPLNAKGNQRAPVKEGNPAVLIDPSLSKCNNHNGILWGPSGRRSNISSGPWPSHDQQYNPFDRPDFNASLLRSGPSNVFAGRAIHNGGNSPYAPWIGFSRIPGISASLHQILPLNAGLQDGRTIPISPGIGVGINMGIGMAIRRSRCPDFEERGYCLRGDLCPMEHGANRIVVEDVQSLSQYNLPVALPTGWGTGTGSGQLSTAAPVPRLSSAFDSRISHETIEKPGISTENVPSTVITEFDLYDPDQPLWSKDRLNDICGNTRFPPFRRGQDDEDWDSGVLGHRPSKIADNVEAKKHARTTARNVSGEQSGFSIRDPIKYFEQRENKGNGLSGISISSGEGVHCRKLLRKDTCEDQLHDGWTMIRQGKNHLQFQQDFDEANTSRATTTNITKGNEMIGTGLEASHEVVARNHGPRPGGDRVALVPSNEKAQRTLYLSCIPVSSNRKELLLAHFQKFGEVLDIRIPIHSERAFVQFSRREDAEAALYSPEAIMGNRFIRLSWAKRDNISDSGEAKMLQSLDSHVTKNDPIVLTQASCAKRPENVVRMHAAADDSIVENIGKSTAANVSMPQKKQEELEHMKEEIRRKQEELAQKRDKFRRKLDQLSRQGTGTKSDSDSDQPNKRHKSEERASLSVSPLKQSAFDAAAESGRSSSEQLISTSGAQKVSLDASKHSSGLFLSNASQPSPLRSPFPRQSITWGPARYKLDNRTTVFRVLPPFPDGFPDIASVREHFASFGDLSSIELEDFEGQNEEEGSKLTLKNPVRVTFFNRRSAERAFIQGRWFQGSLLQLAWFSAINVAGGTTTSETRHFETIGENDVLPIVSQSSGGALSIERGVQKQQEMTSGDNIRSENEIMKSEDQSVRAEDKTVGVSWDEGFAKELSHVTHETSDEKQQGVLRSSENIAERSMELDGKDHSILIKLYKPGDSLMPV